MFVQNRDHSTVTGKLTMKSSKSGFEEYSVSVSVWFSK